MQLETADAYNSTFKSANIRRIVQKRRNIIPVKRHGIRELVPCNLHAVAGVAREADDRLIQDFALILYRWNFCERRHSSPKPPLTDELPLPQGRAAQS